MWIGQQIIVEDCNRCSKVGSNSGISPNKHKAPTISHAFKFLETMETDATFSVTSNLHEQFFVCDNFYLSHKS